MKSTLVLLAVLLATGASITTRTDAANGGNPIRKVITMMEKMSEKIESEAEKESDLYEKFDCYCKNTVKELEENIMQAESNPISPADIEKKESEIVALQQEVTKLKDDRIAEEESLKAATAQRGKEHDHYMEEVYEETEVVHSVDTATQALSGPPEGAAAFLQKAKGSKSVSKMLRAVERAGRVDTEAKQKVTAFLSGQRSAADPGYVVGMLSEIKDDTLDEIKVENQTEDAAVENYGEVKTAKKTEISTLLNQFERKMKSIGEMKVEVVNMKHELGEMGESIADDKKMLAELKKSCSKKAADWEARKSARAEEQLALKDTIKILNDDKSLDLFRSRSSAFLQLSSNREKARHEALAMVKAARQQDAGHPELNFLALALAGKKADFGKVLDKIDTMVELLANESADDTSKQAYCKKEFREVAEKSKTLDAKIKSLTASVTEKKTAITKLSEDISGLQKGVKSLDESVAKAGDNRKAEHSEYQESMTSNSAALDLLTLARDHMNKVYNPTMVTETTTKSPYDPYALLQSSFIQLKALEANAVSFFQRSSSKVQQPPPTFEGGYQKKSEESNGVLKMIDTLSSDIEKEMAVAKTEEENAQADYQETVADAAKKREADMALAASKAQDKADLEGDLNDDKKENAGKKKELAAAAKYTSDLHGECDWLLQHFDLREQARTEEKESLIRAKTVLGGM